MLVTHMISSSSGDYTHTTPIPMAGSQLGYVRCGICKGDSLQNPSKTYYCPSCMSFKLLKYNLNKINLHNVNSTATHDINCVLKVCFDENVRDFLSGYIQQLPENTDEERKLPDTNVSINSVARLAFMLMNVDIVKKQEHIKEVIQLVETEREQCDRLEKRVQLLKQMKKNKQKLINQYKNEISPVVETEITTVEARTRDFQIGIVDRQKEYIRIRQKQAVYDLIYLWNVKTTNNKLSIMYTPIIPITQIVQYSMHLILNSITKSSELVDTLARILQIEVPFKVSNTRGHFGIGDITIKFRDFDNVTQLNNIQFLKFCVCFSRLILNTVILLIRVDDSFRVERHNLKDLMSYDVLIMRIIRKVAGDKEEMVWRQEKLQYRKQEEKALKKKKKKKKNSVWKEWIHKQPTPEEQLPVADKLIPRYELGLHEYSQIVETGLLPDLRHAALPSSTIEATDLIHDDRRLSEEVFKVLNGLLKGPKGHSPHLKKLQSSQWVLT